jgi:glycosyltransferase involved in cell wall biosynthesis
MEPTLSILIPSKNRYETLIPVVTALLHHLPSPRLQVVIEDNSTTNDIAALRELLASDSRIVYHHDPAPISIVENSTRAIEHSSGDYLCFIGDDDFVSPYILDAVDQLHESGLQCLMYPAAYYWWQSVVFAKETLFHRPGAFWLPKQRNGKTRVLSSSDELRKVLDSGGAAYMDLPRLYHGIVHRDALVAIKQATGTFLPGSSPDMAFSAALALVLNSYLTIDYPVTVFGASKNSGGGWTAARKHYGRIEDQAHLPKNILSRWDARLPRVWSEQIIYPQTIYEVMTAFGRGDSGVDFDALYASLLINEPHLFPLVWPLVKRHCTKAPKRIPRMLMFCLRKAAGKVRRAVRSRLGLSMPFDLMEFSAVDEAMRFMRDSVRLPR